MTSSGVLRRVALVRTDVSEETSTSFIGVISIELGTTLAVTSRHVIEYDRLCGLVLRVLGCQPKGPGFDYRRYQILCVAVVLEKGQLSLVRINEELLERKVAAAVYKSQITGRGGSAALTRGHPFIRKSWHQISPISAGRSVGIVRLRSKGHGVCCIMPYAISGTEIYMPQKMRTWRSINL
jgi:hypothetical protein